MPSLRVVGAGKQTRQRRPRPAKPPFDVCIVGGLGRAGLPLGIRLAQAGRRVVLYDLDRRAVETVSGGTVPFLERGAQPVLREVLGKTLFATVDRQAISASRFVVVVIGTPVDDHLNPDFPLFRKLFADIVDCLRDGQHIVLRSTVFPGTTEWTREFLAAAGKRLHVSFCPERISEGEAMDELLALPQIVSAFDTASRREAAALFRLLTPEILFLEPLAAELGKLFTNVWRYINFAISNQFLQIASEHGLDYHRIHRAITHNYPRLAHMPTPGFTAGPCLFKDTMQLAAFSNNSFFLGHAAMLINEGLPNHLVRLLKRRFPLRRLTVGILGMAFKANNDDPRQSLSYKLRRILEIEAGGVLCSDVYIARPDFVTAEQLLARSDVIVLGAPHREYAGLTFPDGTTVVDVWDFYGRGLGV